VATRGSVFIRKCVAPIRALIVPKGCSTVLVHVADLAPCVYRELHPYHVSESPNLNGDDRSVLPLAGPVCLAVQVEEPT